MDAVRDELTNVSSTTTLNASPKVFFHQRALFSVQVTTNGGGTATGNVVLVGDGTRQFGPLLTLDGNGAAAYSTLLRFGTYNVHAIYLGDSNHQGSTVTPQTVS